MPILLRALTDSPLKGRMVLLRGLINAGKGTENPVNGTVSPIERTD